MELLMKLPTFLIVGVQKAGTTSIYNYLKQHPQIYMSPVKETNFLEKDWQKADPEILKKYPKQITTFEQYCQLFEAVTNEIAIGEASPNYLFHYESSAPLIQRYVPHAQLIAILRNPAERAYSDHLMHIRDGIGDRSLSDQIKYSVHKSFIIRKGFYYTPLKHYFDTFGREQVQVYLYDDLCRSPVDFVQNIYRSIGVDDSFSPDVSLKSQVAKIPKNKLVNNLLQKQNPVRKSIASVLKSVLPLEARQRVRTQIIELNSQSKDKLYFQAEDRKQLMEIYREDILKLQDLIQRDLSPWLSI
jgi:hypothetical protein